MRILSMIASLAESGGAEMLVRNLSLDYAARGHRCHVIYIADAAALHASAAFEQGFKDALDTAGIGYSMIGHDSRRNPLAGAWRLRRIVAAFRPDIVHMHLGYGLLMQALSGVRAPTIYTHHNTVFKFPTALFRLFDTFVDRYVAICDACDALLAKHVRRPITLIHNGVPATFGQAPARATMPRDVKVLSVGNLSAQKDYPSLIAAAAALVPCFAAQGRRITFAIAGEGGERPALEADIAARGLGDHVQLLGARRDIAALMADADLLVLASRYEGLPITLIEAAMSALPVVATDVGGCGDIVADGGNGLLVPPGEPGRLADAVANLLSDEARYVAFSATALHRAERFTLAACTDAHLRLYEEVRAARRR